MSLYSFINGFILLTVFNIPCETVGLGVTILSLRDGVKVDDVLAGKVVLLVRDDWVSILLSTKKVIIQLGKSKLL